MEKGCALLVGLMVLFSPALCAAFPIVLGVLILIMVGDGPTSGMHFWTARWWSDWGGRRDG